MGAMEIVTAEEMREIDHRTITEFGIPGAVLMENAGREATRLLLAHFGDLRGKPIGILCGGGNNGGDGYVIARYLFHKGARPTLFLLLPKEKIKGDAALNLSLLGPLKIPIQELTTQAAVDAAKNQMAHQHLFVDALFGTGLNQEIQGHIKEVILHINHLDKPVLSVDIPSGIHSNTGQILGAAIKADMTATFAFAKVGHLVYPGAAHAGRLEVIDIGIPHHIRKAVGSRHFLLTEPHVKSCLPKRSADAHKGSSGHLMIVAGAPGKTGAAALTSRAALRSGAGLVTLLCPRGSHAILESLVVEAMTAPLSETPEGSLSETACDAVMSLASDKKCLAIGPGIGTALSTRKLVQRIVKESPLPLVIDADGINCVAFEKEILKISPVKKVLTPHPGEMARLTGLTTDFIQKNRIRVAREFAVEYQVFLVLKGARTLIAHPDGRIWINPTGNAGMASAGMGDVLTGMIAGLITQGAPMDEALCAAVYLHGKAADTLSEHKGPMGYIASDLIETIPLEIRDIVTRPEKAPGDLFSTKIF